MKKSVPVIFILQLYALFCYTQHVGINNNDPNVSLDITGGFAHRSVVIQPFLNAINLPPNISFLAIGTVNVTGDVTITDPEPWVDGRRLIIHNTTGFNASFSGDVIPANGTKEYICKAPAGGWKAIGNQNNSGSNWSLTGNAGTNPSNQFLGTTDGNPLTFKTNGEKRMAIHEGKSELKFFETLADTNRIIMSNENPPNDGVDWHIASYVNDYFLPSLNFSTRAKGQFSFLGKPNILNLGSDGFVGIGTYTGAGKLTVNHRTIGSSYPSIMIVDSSTNNTSGGILQFTNTFGTPNLNIHGLIGNSSTGLDSYLQFSRNGYYLMRIRGDGNVGIGEGGFDPNLAGLTVRKKVSNTHAIFGDNTTGVSISSDMPGIHFNSIKNDGETSSLTAAYAGGIDHNTNTGNLNFYTTSTTLPTETSVIVAPDMILSKNGDLQLMGSRYLELGSNVTKEVNSGKIGYATFTPNTLDIVGAGTNAGNRKIKLWGEGGINTTGTLDIGGSLKINGSSGTAGQVLTSNGSSAPTWQNQALSNNVRFEFRTDNSTGPGGNFNWTYTAYNTNPTAVTLSGGEILFNVSGLYNIEIEVDALVVLDNPYNGVPPNFLMGSFFTGTAGSGAYGNHKLFSEPLLQEYPATTSYSRRIPYRGTYYIAAGTTLNFNYSFTHTSSSFTLYSAYIDCRGHLISE